MLNKTLSIRLDEVAERNIDKLSEAFETPTKGATIKRALAIMLRIVEESDAIGGNSHVITYLKQSNPEEREEISILINA